MEIPKAKFQKQVFGTVASGLYAGSVFFLLYLEKNEQNSYLSPHVPMPPLVMHRYYIMSKSNRYWCLDFVGWSLRAWVRLPTPADCTWRYIDQPLSHFEKNNAAFFRQRLCVFLDYWKPYQSLPVFLYTGNESPVEEYVNNTGLIWNLAKQMVLLLNIGTFGSWSLTSIACQTILLTWRLKKQLPTMQC